MKKLLSIIFISITTTFSADAIEKTPLKSTALGQSQSVKAKGIWIDVRSPQEFAAGHLREAVNIPYDQIAVKIAEISPNKNEPINLYCRSGRRSGIALEELKKLGYTNVVNHGGYRELIEKGIR